MTPAEPVHLHDFTPRTRRLTVDVRRSSLFDLLLALWSAFGGDDKAAAHDLGAEWFDEFRTSMDGAVRARIESVAGERGWLWVVVAGLLTETPDQANAEDLLARLSGIDPADLRRAVVAEMTWDVPGDLVERVAAGDSAALDELLAMPHLSAHADKAGVIKDVLDELDAGSPSELAGVLRDLWAGAFAPYAEEWRPGLDRSAQATRLLTGSLEPTELIETVTNGISYEIPLGITRLVLVPSVVIRPWTLVTEHDRSLVVFYPVADEHLSADPDAPPGWLVRLHKALGDDRRLRILRRVTEEEATLADLTDMLGLAKSTVFHHIGVLRGAGLIRVRMGSDDAPTYTLREGALSDAHRALVAYLTASTNGGSR